MLRFCVIVGFCIWVSHAAYTLEEYNRRQTTVNKMNNLYKKIERVPIFDEQKRDEIQSQVRSLCATEFGKSETWLVNALKDPTGSLIEVHLKANKFNISKTKAFIKAAFGTVETAINMSFWCSVLEENESEAKRLVEFKGNVLPSLTKTLTDRLLSDFTKSVKPTVDGWLSVNHLGYNEHAQNFINTAAGKLQKTYPSSQWITTAFSNTEHRKICLRPGTFSYMTAPKHQKDWVFIAILREDGQNDDVKAADDALARIGPGSRRTKCADAMDNIMREANYQCGSDKFTAFVMFTNAVFGVSDPNLFKTKDVSRKGKCGRFKVGIFA